MSTSSRLEVRRSLARASASALLFAVAFGCANTPHEGERSAPGEHAERSGRADLARSMDALFPAPTQGLRVKETATLADLVDDFSTATGWAVLTGTDGRRGLQLTPVGLGAQRDVPANEVYVFVESVLVQQGYALAITNAGAPRILTVVPLRGPGASLSRSGAGPVEVEPADLDGWERAHPGIRLQTVVLLEHADARALTNSLRAYLQDANVQVLMPLGNGSTVLLSGFAPWMRQMRALLARLDVPEPDQAPARAR